MPLSTKFQAAAAPVAPLTIPLPLEENEEPVKERVYLSSWDPTPLLKELYEIRLMDDDTEDLSYKFIEMEGLMEKLPMNKKKATLLKTWKRRYFRAKNGWLVYYDNRNDEKPSDELLLMGGQIHAMGNQVIGIDDGKVVLIEFGSMSIRAGILKENATLPQLFFPNTVAVSSENNMVKHVIGFDAYKPEVRHSSQLVQPFGPTDKVDKFKVDFDTLPSVFTAIFKDLKIATEEYYVIEFQTISLFVSTCFVSKNFNEDCQQYQKNPEKFRETLYLKKYNIPDEIYTTISHSLSRFVSPEGLFNTDLWGMDYPTIQSLVMNAIQACPLDNRRHLCSNTGSHLTPKISCCLHWSMCIMFYVRV
ncbi:unnamed protein product [Acanthosepion pharaonis]|uniref:PH domain-containing protein n=1 Tax=Acanthosepion pharaonis TaxID=158019 RepID=A0A812CDF7_ACAPH|nr:unnamed protein product [Sepia pharaonis]